MVSSVKTVEELVEGGLLEAADGSLFHAAIERRSEIAAAEKTLDADKKGINAVLSDLAARTGIVSFRSEGIGSVSIQKSSRSSLSTELVKKKLLTLGWETGAIVDFLEECSTLSVFSSVVFKPTKMKEGE